MRVEEAYDLIVIGDQLSGLFLAAGAASQGKKVLVLEESSFPTVLYEAPSGRLLGDFMAEPAVGLEDGTPVDAFLKSLGLYQELDQLFPRHEPPLQLVSTGLRMDFPYRAEKLAQEVKREIELPPDQQAKLVRLLSGEVLSKQSFSRVVSEAGMSVGFEILGSLQSALYGSLLRSDFPYSEYSELMAQCSLGVRFPQGGRGALKERLLARIQILGGSIRRNSHVEEIVFERKRLAGVLLSSYEGFVRSSRVVGAMAAGSFARLVPEEMRSARLNTAVQKVKPKAWKLGFTLLVPEAVIPEGLGTHLALLDPDVGLKGDGFLQLQVFAKDVYGGIPPKHRAILGRILVPFEEQYLAARPLSNLLKRALSRVHGLLPFLGDQPYSFFPDPENLEKDPVYMRYYRFPDLRHIPDSLLVYERTFGDDQPQSAFLSWEGLGLPGLALCSRDIRPLHGLIGEALSAMELLNLWKSDKKFSAPPPRKRGAAAKALPLRPE